LSEYDGSSTDSPSAWDTATSWLRTCSRDHKCRARSDIDLPTRLIYVGGSNESPRLVETKNVPPSSEYCTLSHCWGSIPMLTLEKHNYHEFLERLPWDELTRTFQHAIVATRKFGYKYIWIDSLCIIQHDNKDWSIESARMATVYKSSVLNLAATAGSDGDSGLFFERDRHSVCIPGVYLSTSARILFLHSGFFQPVQQSALLTRGWVLQERWLSPRTLHFTRHEGFQRKCRGGQGLYALEQVSPDIFQLFSVQGGG
jgi:hypothetical protein